MKLSISNIAWPSEQQDKFFRLIKELGCSGVEIAPGILWNDPAEVSAKKRSEFKATVNGHGLEVSAVQALLFGHPDLGLFRDKTTEAKTVEYLKGLCRLAADLGARPLVFGSPGNRRRGHMGMNAAFERAAGFFSQVAGTAADLGVVLCIEPLRPQETDFITTAKEGLDLVEMVDSPGFGLHLDVKAVSEEGGDFDELVRAVLPRLKHVHVNDPDLTEVNSTGTVAHGPIAAALGKAGYDGYVSIEMRKAQDHEGAVRRSLAFTRETYIDTCLV